VYRYAYLVELRQKLEHSRICGIASTPNMPKISERAWPTIKLKVITSRMNIRKIMPMGGLTSTTRFCSDVYKSTNGKRYLILCALQSEKGLEAFRIYLAMSEDVSKRKQRRSQIRIIRITLISCHISPAIRFFRRLFLFNSISLFWSSSCLFEVSEPTHTDWGKDLVYGNRVTVWIDTKPNALLRRKDMNPSGHH